MNYLNFHFPMMKPNFVMPNFGTDVNALEVQNYLLFIMNFYEIHMNNLKAIIIQQNETISNQKQRIKVLPDLSVLKD